MSDAAVVDLEPGAPASSTAPEAAEVSLVGVADNLSRLLRAFGQARSRVIAKAEHEVEWSAFIVLKHLRVMGAMRAGSLADLMHADPSTVSRQVAALVKDGFIERRSDPHDGRASLLVLTEFGTQTVRRHDDLRMRWFSQMLTDWQADDLERFAGLLARFTDDFDAMDHGALADQIVAARLIPVHTTTEDASARTTTTELSAKDDHR